MAVAVAETGRRRHARPSTERRVYDVVVAGSGPGGTSVATFLARRGVSVLLLDRAGFPRDKVCGDGLTPQAIYWLDRLGCAAEVWRRRRHASRTATSTSTDVAC